MYTRIQLAVQDLVKQLLGSQKWSLVRELDYEEDDKKNVQRVIQIDTPFSAFMDGRRNIERLVPPPSQKEPKNLSIAKTVFIYCYPCTTFYCNIKL